MHAVDCLIECSIGMVSLMDDIVMHAMASRILVFYTLTFHRLPVSHRWHHLREEKTGKKAQNVILQF